MKTTDVKKGQLVLTPAYVIRRGIDRAGRDWKIRARVVGPGPNGMIMLRSVDRELNAALPRGEGRTIYRRARDLATA